MIHLTPSSSITFGEVSNMAREVQYHTRHVSPKSVIGVHFYGGNDAFVEEWKRFLELVGYKSVYKDPLMKGLEDSWDTRINFWCMFAFDESVEKVFNAAWKIFCKERDMAKKDKEARCEYGFIFTNPENVPEETLINLMCRHFGAHGKESRALAHRIYEDIGESGEGGFAVDDITQMQADSMLCDMQACGYCTVITYIVSENKVTQEPVPVKDDACSYRWRLEGYGGFWQSDCGYVWSPEHIFDKDIFCPCCGKQSVRGKQKKGKVMSKKTKKAKKVNIDITQINDLKDSYICVILNGCKDVLDDIGTNDNGRFTCDPEFVLEKCQDMLTYAQRLATVCDIFGEAEDEDEFISDLNKLAEREKNGK